MTGEGKEKVIFGPCMSTSISFEVMIIVREVPFYLIFSSLALLFKCTHVIHDGGYHFLYIVFCHLY